MALGSCFLFGGAVDVVTTLYVYFGRNLDLQTLVNIMYLPAAMSFLFSEDKLQFISDVLGITKVCLGYLVS